MTPAQLRAFASVVRQGSVKAAAHEMGLTESAVSMHVAQLRKELGDQLFERTRNGLAFTPGGLRLAKRALEILGLQDLTVTEVAHAAEGRRMLRLGATGMFAEHAAPGLIEQFTRRARDLDVELSVHRAEDFDTLLQARAIDAAVGPLAPATKGLVQRPFLSFELQVVTAPGTPYADQPTPARLRRAPWLLGPGAIGTASEVPRLLAALDVPEARQRFFQSEAAALEEVQRGRGVSVALGFAVKSDLAAGRLVPVATAGARVHASWGVRALPPDRLSATADLLQYLGTPRAIQAMLRGSGVPITRFRPSVYVTLWS